MRYIVLLFAAVWLALGIAAIYVPENVTAWMAAVLEGWFMRPFGALVMIMGVVFLVASTRLHGRWYLIVLGIICLLKGALFTFLPMSFCKALMDISAGMPIWAIRMSAIVSTGMAIAVAVLAIVALFEEDVI